MEVIAALPMIINLITIYFQLAIKAVGAGLKKAGQAAEKGVGDT